MVYLKLFFILAVSILGLYFFFYYYFLLLLNANFYQIS